jgi:CrcB protein
MASSMSAAKPWSLRGGRARLLVFAGGAIGTGLRYAAFRIWYHRPGTFPTTTLVVNSLGALVLGATVAVIVGVRRDADWHAFLRVGVLGGFTTFSAYTIELAEYVRDDRIAMAAVYAVSMTLIGIVSAIVGLIVGRELRARSAP